MPSTRIGPSLLDIDSPYQLSILYGWFFVDKGPKPKLHVYPSPDYGAYVLPFPAMFIKSLIHFSYVRKYPRLAKLFELMI